MLTPQEISDKVFVKAVFGGYDMTGVDDFLESVSADYAALYKENAILKSKIKVLVEKVEEYRSTEDAMRMALLTAQKMGEDIMSDANRKSAEALSKTENEVNLRLSEMRGKIADEETRLKAAARETAKFVEVSREIIRRHSEFLSKIDKIRRAVESAPAPPPPPTREEQIADTAQQIGSAVEKLTAAPIQQAPVQQAPVQQAPVQQAPVQQAPVQQVPVQQVPVQQAPVQQMPVQQVPVQQAPVQQAPVQQVPVQQVPVQQAPVQQVPVQQAPVQQIPVQQAPVYDDESEPTRLYVGKNTGGDDSLTPRPKFDFDNLKFGTNFTGED